MSAGKPVDEIHRASVTAVELTDAHGRRRTVDVSELDEADLALVEQFGYQPVLKRTFGSWASYSFALSISGVFSTVMTTIYYPLLAGGGSCAVWAWLISSLSCLTLAASVAEISSAYPQSGGVYYAISRLLPPRWVPVVSWVQAWLNTLGQVAGIASSEYGSAQLLLAIVSLSTGYVPTTNHTIACMAGLTLVAGAINSVSSDALEKVTRTYAVAHGLILLSCVICLLVLTPEKHSAAYVFTSIEGSSGWDAQTSTGFAFLFGFLSASWTMTDYDGLSHLAEEIREPEIRAPRALWYAMITTVVAGFLFTCVLVACMGDPQDAINSSLGQPAVFIFANAMGVPLAIVFSIFGLLVLQFVCWSALQALARTIFAYSRDRLFPFSNTWTIVNKRTNTPLYAVFISTFLCIAVNMISFAGYVAISGVFNVTAAALDISYIIVVCCKLLYPSRFKPGPWYMGKRLSTVVNLYATGWTIFVSLVIFMLPVSLPATLSNANYAPAFLCGILVLSLIYYLVSGRHYYTGPAGPPIQHEAGSSIAGEKFGKHDSESDGDRYPAVVKA